MYWPWFRPIPWYTKIARVIHCGFNYVCGVGYDYAGYYTSDTHRNYLLEDIEFIWEESRNWAVIKGYFKELLKRMKAEG